MDEKREPERRRMEVSEEKDVLILAIESSCDETAASVVKNGREVLSNVISSQIALHTSSAVWFRRLHHESILKRLIR